MSIRHASLLAAPVLFVTLAPATALPHTTVTPIDAALTRWDMASARAIVAKMPDGAERCAVEGVIASRENRLEDAASLLSRCIPLLEQTMSPRVDPAVDTLVDVYRRGGDYAREHDLIDHWLKAHVYAKQTDRYANFASEGRRVLTLRDVRPIGPTGDTATYLTTYVNPLGTRSVDLTVNGRKLPWMIDTGANYSVLSESAARRMKLTLRDASYEVVGSTDHSVTTRFAVVPRLPIGGIVLHNVVAAVVPDAALYMRSPRYNYQIEAALGYPALAQLGRFRMDAHGTLTIDRAGPLLRSGARLYMDQLTPLVEVEISGDKQLFKIDTGATRTTLYASYAARFSKSAGTWRRTRTTATGLGGRIASEAAIEPRLQVVADGRSITERDVSVALKGNRNDPFLGNIGQPLLMANGSYTFDFRTMRILFGPEVPASEL